MTVVIVEKQLRIGKDQRVIIIVTMRGGGVPRMSCILLVHPPLPHLHTLAQIGCPRAFNIQCLIVPLWHSSKPCGITNSFSQFVKFTFFSPILQMKKLSQRS